MEERKMLCVLAKLSDEATGILAEIQSSAFSDKEDFEPLHGHITLASYEGNDELRFVRSCRELLKDIPSFDIRYEKIEVFYDPFIIVAKPGKSDNLDTMHQLIADEYNDELNSWTKTGFWNPHTSLYAKADSDTQEIIQKISDAFHPFSASIIRIEFSRVLEAGYEIIDSMDLPFC